MNCQVFWETVPDARRYPGAAHEQHLQQCGACAARLHKERSLLHGLQTLAAESRQQGSPRRVEARLVAAFRGHVGLAPEPRRAWIPILTWATAAALTAALGIFLIRGRQPEPPRRSPRAIELAVQQPPAAVRNYVTLASFEGEFIPLPNRMEISPNDEVNLVRLRVPRSALIALGVAAGVERASESVEADFVLGTDGLARAVRWVDQ